MMETAAPIIVEVRWDHAPRADTRAAVPDVGGGGGVVTPTAPVGGSEVTMTAKKNGGADRRHRTRIEFWHADMPVHWRGRERRWGTQRRPSAKQVADSLFRAPVSDRDKA
jgi:hypothetical protein